MRTPINYCKGLVIAGIFFFQIQTLFGQSNGSASSIESRYTMARDYYQKGQRSIAYPMFKSLYNSSDFKRGLSTLPQTLKTNVQYYTLEGSLSLDDSTIVKEAKEFEEQSPDAVRRQMISYHLGEYYYRRNRFLEAVKYYSKAGYKNLSKEEIASSKFHKGYSYFQLGDYTSAGPLLYTISGDATDPNYIDANYYYGFIALDEKDYAQALKCFKAIEGDAKYKTMVPYFIAEVYYFMGDIDKAIEYGKTYLHKDGKLFYANDLQLLLGHAYYDKGDYSKALNFLQTYAAVVPGMHREDIYQLSYCFYQMKNYQNAKKGFLQVTDSTSRDSVYQNSMYFLASSYLWLGENAAARNAYLECSRIMTNKAQKENAYFNYIKLSYDIGDKDTALVYLNDFMTAYPNSDYKQDANDLLILLLTDNRKFKEAYEATERMGVHSTAIQEIYPLILYGRALELIMDEQKYSEAKPFLIAVTNSPYNEKEKQPAYFWLGRVYNSIGRYDTSQMAISEYLRNPVILGDVNPINAYYILGNDYLQVKDYKNALSAYEKVAAKISPASNDIEMDAYCKQGDCYFMMREYNKALSIYDQLIKSNYKASDYCYSQKGVIAKVQGHQDEAIANFQAAESKLGDDSKASAQIQIEMAQTYMSQGNYAKAVAPLQAVIKNRNIDDAQYSKALLNLGVCQYNLNNYNMAEDAFGKVVLKYPGTEDANSAKEYLKSVYSVLNRPEGYVKVNERIGQKISAEVADSLYYSTAVDFYNNKNWENAVEAFKKYLVTYPNGAHTIDARYNLASIEANNLKDSAAAASDYQYIVDHTPNQYVENALYHLARINYFKFKDDEKALSYFSLLKSTTTKPEMKFECIKGSIRIQYKLHRWENAYTNAQDLLTYPNAETDDKQLANLVIGKNMQIENKLDDAINYYNKVVALGKTQYATEAQYYTAQALFAQNKVDDAEKAAMVAVEKIAVSDYWTESAYILLGQIYYQKKDYYNASATLKSIVENTHNDDLKKEAKELLDKVDAASQTQQTQPQSNN